MSDSGRSERVCPNAFGIGVGCLAPMDVSIGAFGIQFAFGISAFGIGAFAIHFAFGISAFGIVSAFPI